VILLAGLVLVGRRKKFNGFLPKRYLNIRLSAYISIFSAEHKKQFVRSESSIFSEDLSRAGRGRIMIRMYKKRYGMRSGKQRAKQIARR